MSRKNWASRDDRERHSDYFILINSKTKPVNDYDRERLHETMDNMMKVIAEQLPEMIRFNNTKRRQHSWGADTINNVNIRYVIEEGEKYGHVHAHIVVRINHHSNITLLQEEIARIANDYLQLETGKRPFVGRPKLITRDRAEEYMTKGEEYDDGIEWLPMTVAQTQTHGEFEADELGLIEEPQTEAYYVDTNEQAETQAYAYEPEDYMLGEDADSLL